MNADDIVAVYMQIKGEVKTILQNQYATLCVAGTLLRYYFNFKVDPRLLEAQGGASSTREAETYGIC